VTVNKKSEGCNSASSCQDREKSTVTLAVMDSLGGTNVRPSECCITLVFINISINHCFLNRGPGTSTSPWITLHVCPLVLIGWATKHDADPGRNKTLTLLESVQAGCGTHAVSYPSVTAGAKPGGKAARP
jgi:hypothetical protein